MSADLPIAERLVKGAAVLGRLFREGKRCSGGGWSSQCSCDEAARTSFCEVKRKWVDLFVQADRALPGGDFEIAEAMTVAELKASGLTVTLDVEGVGKVRVGPKGDVPVDEFRTMGGDVLPTVLQVLRSFPGAKVLSGGTS